MPRGPISRQVDAVRKKATRPLISRIQPSKKRKTNLRFGFVFSFKLSTILIIAFYLLAGAGLTFVISKSLRATEGDNISTVDFYANTANVTINQGGGSGWSGIEKVLGEPQVQDNDEQNFYTADNSAVYQGGKQALILDNFTTKEFIKTSYDKAVQSTTTVPEISQEPASSDSLQNNQETSPAVNASATTEIIDNSETPAESASSADVSTDSSAAAAPAVIPEIPATEPPPAIIEGTAGETVPAEVAALDQPTETPNHLPSSEPVSFDSGNSSSVSAETSVPAASVETSAPAAPAETSAPSGQSAAPVSLLGDLKKITALSHNLLGQVVKAQSLFGSEADDRNILFGAFKSAKIKISVAALQQAVENNQPAPVPVVAPVAPVSETGSSSASEAIGSALENPADNISAPAAENNPENSAEGVPAENAAAPTLENPAENVSAPAPVSAPEDKTPSAASVIMEKVLDFFAPNQAGAEEMATSTDNKTKIVIWYSFANEGAGDYWRQLGTIDTKNLTDATAGNYLIFDAPFLNDWRDLDDLRIKFEGVADSGNFTVYLDSVLAEISYENGKNKPEEKKPEVNKDVLNVDGQEIDFTNTDNNDNENLIIKTNAKKYFGLTNATVYFSVENTGVRAENVNFQYYFPDGQGSISKLEKLDQDSPYLLETPKIEAQIYECANGWDKRDDTWTCYPTGEEKICNLVSPNRRYCRVEGVETGSEKKIKYQNRWEDIGLDEKVLLPEKSFFKRLLGLGPQNKPVPETLQPVKATADSVAIAPGEVKYYKATINFPPNSEGEFYIEAVGDGDGYGLLDPWWNSGWNFRLPIKINNSYASPLTQQQIYLEISSSTSRDFWRNIRSDGGDIRFTNSTETTELPYWIQSFDYAASSTKIWVQVDSLPAATTSEIFLYYGKASSITTSNPYTPFTYSNLENIFYTASSSVEGTLKVVSLIDNNQVQLDNQTVVNLNRQDIATFTGFASTSVIKAKGPIMAKISNKAAAESAIPISFAGNSFIITSSLNTETFHVYSPYEDATTTFYEGATLRQTKLVTAGTAFGYSRNIAQDNITTINATKPVLLTFAASGPSYSLIGYPATTDDLYGVKAQYNFIGGTAVSSFSILCSSHSSTTISSLPAGTLQTNQICVGGTETAGDAVRISGATGALNATQNNDSDGNEATMFWPFKEFSSEYMLPTSAAHIDIVCAPQSGAMELSVYNSSNVFVASTSCQGTGIYPGKAVLGVADATTYTAGSRIVSDAGQPFYAYYEDTAALGAAGGDETNLIGAVQARKSSYPLPTYTFGAQEIKGPPTGTINSAAEKNDNSGRLDISIAVNDISNDNSRAKIEYVQQSAGVCNFATPLKPTLDENNVSATFGAPVIQNKNAYQIGTTTGWIETDSGTNVVNFVWNSKTDLPTANGVYCLRLTANDNLSDQLVSATTTVAIDNLAPTVPGILAMSRRTGTSITLQFGATSTDSNFKQYKIYYKQYDGTPVTEAGTLFGSSSDANLGAANFNKVATTTISGLTAGLKYTFNIFAYDVNGNKASSTTGVDIIANDAPTGIFNSAQEKIDGSGRVDISVTANDANLDNTLRAKIEYEAGSLCTFVVPLKPKIDSGNITATFGTVNVDPNDAYQVGTTSNYILTSFGANTVNFDWLSNFDTANATGTYCLRLTLNDGVDDQAVTDKIVVVIDNAKPVASGSLAKGTTAQNSLQLLLPKDHIAIDDNEPLTGNAYKIFYKVGTSGVKQTDSQFINSALSVYSFNGSSSVIVSSLTPGTNYVFNIWAYDAFGNTASATEITIKTDSDLTNKSLTFVNPQSGSSTLPDLAVADNATPWDFRAVVSDVGGFALINDITLRLADLADNATPFDDLKFKWTQAGNSFSETGSDINSAATLDAGSASSCAGDSCTIDFKIVFAKTFATTSTDYAAELYSTDSAARTAEDSFLNIFQVRKNWLNQIHYRWRNDDGGG